MISVYNALEFPSAKTISPSLLTSDFWAVSQSSYVNRYSARFESLQNNSHVIESAMPGHIRAQRQMQYKTKYRKNTDDLRFSFFILINQYIGYAGENHTVPEKRVPVSERERKKRKSNLTPVSWARIIF